MGDDDDDGNEDAGEVVLVMYGIHIIQWPFCLILGSLLVSYYLNFTSH